MPPPLPAPPPRASLATPFGLWPFFAGHASPRAPPAPSPCPPAPSGSGHCSNGYSRRSSSATVGASTLFMMCSTAERERELACSSAADGRTVASITSAAPGCSGGARPAVTCAWYQRACGISSRTASCLRKKSTTSAHSECFQVMTPIRPPGQRRERAASRPREHSPNSSLRCTRSAWKVSLAGCIAWYSQPLARATRAANSLVRLGSAPSCRARTMASATRCAAAPSDVSPKLRRTRVISARGAVERNSWAVCPRDWSKRRSRGPSASGRKPRCASSNCGDEMPRSKRIAATPPPPPEGVSAR
mmetsp:Transcript_49920/g.161229  ORF Transcript_49920/g.161229 Transcript_49920/m.161229 type:complete len:304 (+) Transcript_49920:166-1077(+)